MLALLAAGSWRSRVGRVASGLAMAAALATRPQVALLLPAMALALDEGARRPGESFGRTARAAAEWGVAAALGLGLAFAPLVLQGTLGDFLRCLRRTALESNYNRVTMRDLPSRVWSQVVERPQVLFVPVAMVALAAGFDRGRRRLAATWLAATAGALFYKPLSPIGHPYLAQNLLVVHAVAVAGLAGLLLDPRRPWPPARALLLLLLLAGVVGPWPEYADAGAARRALPDLIRGEMPERAPHCGALVTFLPWRDYRAMIGYLRRHAPPGTYVANALPSMAAVDGPIAALPPMPGESLSWFGHFGRDAAPLAGQYARCLERSPALYVVWSPEGGRGGPPLPDQLVDVILRDFTPEARFGPYEVRRKKAGGH